MKSPARWSAALVLPAVLLLPACGGDDGGTTTAAPTAAAAGPQNGPGGADFQKIQECLTAAGITVPTPSGTFQRPTGTPPSGAPRGGGGGGFGGIFQSEEAQAALKACGITMPTGRPGGPGPSASPTS